MIKSADAFRTISEVADWLDTETHVLRFWETKFVQIKPIKRGGGRRYYRPEDIRLLKGIKILLYNDGYTIRGVQKVIKENGTKKILMQVDQNKNFTNSEISNNDLGETNSITNYNISETKRKKLLNVLEDLVELRKKLDTDK